MGMAINSKTRVTPQEFDLIQVEWVDSEKEEEWTTYPPSVEDLPIMRTVGFFYTRTKGAIVLSQTIDKKVFHGVAGLVEGVFSIPNVAVKEVIIIKRFSKKNKIWQQNKKTPIRKTR